VVRFALSHAGDEQGARARQRALWVETIASAVPLLFLLIKSITYVLYEVAVNNGYVVNSIHSGQESVEMTRQSP
jgi:hypothetical protein